MSLSLFVWVLRSHCARRLVFMAAAALPLPGWADEQVSYSLGMVNFVERDKQIEVSIGRLPPLKVDITPGGRLVPDVELQETGTLWVGRRSYGIYSGKLLASSRPPCRLTTAPDFGLAPAWRGTVALLLLPTVDDNGRPVEFTARLVDARKCRVIATGERRITGMQGVFEFRSSAAGWWAVATQDAAIQISADGLRWRSVTAPPQVNKVLAVRWRSNGELWVLANRIEQDSLALVLAVTRDEGRNWTEQPAVTANLPPSWFEGTRTIANEGR